MRQPDRRSKIVCTMGPAVSNPESIAQLIEAGMDVARINFSHGTHESHGRVIQMIREVSQRLNLPVAILGDLQGPKIRTGRLLPTAPGVSQVGGANLYFAIEPKQTIWFTGVDIGQPAKPGDGTRERPITISYPRLAHDLKPGDAVLFEDGLIRMRTLQTEPSENLVLLVVEHGKLLGENKGVNMPGARLTTLGVTEKDWEDVLFATSIDVDFLALSFVRTAREIRHLKGFLEKKNLHIQVIAKIEKAEAIDNIDEILRFTDGIMVARGDLGVEIGNEKVPIAQKKLIQKARAAGKPVITATQMLMSMVSSPVPTRAEASDVANAVLDGSDALMLSNETATGEFPIESVLTMATIIRSAEEIGARDYAVKSLVEYTQTGQRLPVSEAIEAAATELAHSLQARCLACLTRSGAAARQLAKYRPQVPIFAFAENEKTRAQLCLTWGVSVIQWKELAFRDHTVFDELMAELVRLNLMRPNDMAIMTAGIPTSMETGTTNTVVVKTHR